MTNPITEKQRASHQETVNRLEKASEIFPYLKEISKQWYVVDGKKLRRKFRLRNFRENIAFVNGIVDMAKEEGHRAELSIQSNTLEVSFWTPDVGGLSENDFIMAAKIDEVFNVLFSKMDVFHLK